MVKPNLMPSRRILVTPELRLEIISADWFTDIPFSFATTASIMMSIIKIGMAINSDWI